MSVKIRVVNENTRTNVQEESFKSYEDAEGFVDELVDKYTAEGWDGGPLASTRLDAVFIKAESDDDDFHAVHVYQVKD